MQIELPAGAVVAGKYRVERLIGCGAIGTVYLTEQLSTGKRVALKCVDASHAPDPAAAARLVREAQAAARIRHDNVVDVYEVGSDDKIVFLVMEYLEGEPLSAVIARRNLPVHKLIALLLPAMRGVAEAHRQGVVHRDIKPDNIFLARQVDAREPRAKVLDFGISKLDARGRSLRALTADGYAIGTPGYMAYEQALGDKTIDGRADVYAFGAILYEALTGRVPREADSFPALVRHFHSQRVLSPRALGVKIPESLSALVMWALERDREQRVSSMESLIRELEPFASERCFASEQDAEASRPARAGTLVGHWGLGRSLARRAQAQATAPSTVEAIWWLERARQRRARRLVLIAGLSAPALGLLGFTLSPRSTRPVDARPAQTSMQSAIAAPPSMAAPAAGTNAAAAGAFAPVRPAEPTPPVGVAPAPKLPVAAPALKPPATQSRSARKVRDFGIY